MQTIPGFSTPTGSQLLLLDRGLNFADDLASNKRQHPSAQIEPSQEDCSPPFCQIKVRKKRKKRKKSLLSFCRFLVLRYRFRIFFVFVRSDGLPAGRGSTPGGLAMGV